MNLKTFHKASMYIEQIKTLDKEIIEIEKLAMFVVNNDCKFNLNLSKHEKTEERATVTRGRNLFTFLYNDMDDYNLYKNYQNEGKTDESPTVKCELTPTATMHVLGALLYEKNQVRAVFIEQLKSFGIEIEP